MSEVIFEEEADILARPNSGPKTSFVTRMVFKLGLAKTEEGANYVMLVIAVLCIALAIGALFAGGIFGNPVPPSSSQPTSTPEPGALP